jgi:pyruvate,water dikinase
VVTDGGGYLTHAVIVARDLRIPAVVGTLEATRKIKDGQRIRVDGNLLRVYILAD